eukprot:TRINITY_DN20938_c0_g1_i1.p1 TRINITY_DN20938_c0_g1~~TRINITY_DN20938_c0_g1_i1.p1  ORF type:complete len:137 (+),score=34.54 TRINITY_DN20938_c0_g1_i1:138-548(+)
MQNSEGNSSGLGAKVQERLAKQNVESPYPKKPATFQKANPCQEIDMPAAQNVPQADTQNYDRTIYRGHKTKDTFKSVFPAYGVLGRENAYATEQSDMSKELENAEPVNWTHHMKTDAEKRHTEAMLKAANMSGKKK